MLRDDSVLYLVLTPEFGGHRFGHFEQMEVRLGSDPQRCHVVLNEALGVAREHVKIIRQQDSSLLIAPAERTAAVFVWKGDARRPAQVLTPTAVRPGDSFSLVTADGPRFVIELGPLPQSVVEARRRPTSGRRALTFDRFMTEAWRIFTARLYTFSPVAIAARAWYYVTSGAIWQPRFIIAGILLMSGWIAAAPTSCAALSYRSQTVKLTETNTDCKQQLAAIEGMQKKGIENYSVAELVQQITSATMTGALEKDESLLARVKERAKTVLAQVESGEFDWLLKGEGDRVGDFQKWRERVEKSDRLDPDTRRFLPWLAVTPGRSIGKFDGVLDTTEKKVCGRGPLRMTYRQAKNLGMESVALDAYVSGDLTQMNDENVRFGLLKKTSEAAGEPPIGDAIITSTFETIREGVEGCAVADLDDDRQNDSKVLRMLEEQLGSSAKFVADAGSTNGVTTRLAKFYAADRPEGDFSDVEKPLILLEKQVTQSLDEVPGKDRIISQTANVIALATVLPCEAVLSSSSERKAEIEKVFGKLPDPLACLVLSYKLTH